MSTSEPDTSDDGESFVVPEQSVRENLPDENTLRLREQATVDAVETIPVPTQRVQNGENFTVVTDDVTAWPNQRLEWRFEYNQFMGRWIFECEHEHMGLLFDGRSVATLGRRYDEYPYLLAEFIAPDSGPAPIEAVTARTLGDAVQLAVIPGPAGGSFLPDAGLTEAEEHALLGRYANDYAVTKEWV